VLGVVSDTWIHEQGNSQFEINLMHGDPVAVADQAFLFKYAAKEIAIKHGMNAVSLAKPISGEAGRSMHLHHSVVDQDGNNIFSNADGSENIRFRQYIAGLQTYVPDMMLIFAPFINSYRRFVEGSQAPVNLEWGLDNRTAGLRVPISGPAARRVENRIAGADANPYLVIAASLAAGLAGIEEGLKPSDPIEGNGYDRGHDLARGFQAAHSQMLASKTCSRLLGDKFVAGYVSTKGLEYQHFLNEISTWERRYLVPQA
jgi:glutamine synthetase